VPITLDVGCFNPDTASWLQESIAGGEIVHRVMQMFNNVVHGDEIKTGFLPFKYVYTS
jgi:hypothetical protein